TIARSVVVNGQGLHTGVRTGLILQPLPPGSGILFGNISSGETVPALIDHVDSTDYATTLARGGMVAKTVEHLMAALHAYGITNVLVKMQGEVPILDGSALELCTLLDEGGLVEQPATVEELVIDRVYALGPEGNGEKGIAIEPADAFEVHYTLDYPPPIGRQAYEFRFTDVDTFRREIAPARTFGFVKEIETLEQIGRAGAAEGGVARSPGAPPAAPPPSLHAVGAPRRPSRQRGCRSDLRSAALACGTRSATLCGVWARSACARS